MNWSKWAKYKIMKKSNKLTPYLPETRQFKKTSLRRMLDSYGKVILKPSGSFGGKGVIQVAAGDSRYAIHADSRKKTYPSFDSLMSGLAVKQLRNYIVQQRIPLARVNKRPFDLRVMVQRRKHSKWIVTGTLAKVAGKGYIVTNIARSKGKVIPVERAIKRSELSALSTDELMTEVHQVALRTARHLDRYYKRLRIVGVDMGFDRSGNVWIIEANFKPATSLFLKLKDRSMYRKVMSYKKRRN